MTAGLGCGGYPPRVSIRARKEKSWASALVPPMASGSIGVVPLSGKSRYAFSLCLVLLLTFAAPLWAQETDVHVSEHPKPPESKANTPPDDPTLKTHTKPIKRFVDLVLVNVTVTDPMNRLVTGLDKENFQIMEGNKAQEIKHFSSEDAPISLGVIFDVSGSMADKIQRSRDAVVEFFKTANPQDEFFLVSFSDEPSLLADFTHSIEDIQGKLVYSTPKGQTALIDAIYLGLQKMHEAKNTKKALLVISDGGDNHSRYTEEELRSLVKEADVQIYSIGIFDPSAPTVEEVRGPELLQEISEATGGRLFKVDNVNDVEDVATKIGVELRNQYVLGYRPSNTTRDGKWRKIKVKLLPPPGLPPLRVYNKNGYYAPSE